MVPQIFVDRKRSEKVHRIFLDSAQADNYISVNFLDGFRWNVQLPYGIKKGKVYIDRIQLTSLAGSTNMVIASSPTFIQPNSFDSRTGGASSYLGMVALNANSEAYINTVGPKFAYIPVSNITGGFQFTLNLDQVPYGLNATPPSNKTLYSKIWVSLCIVEDSD